MEKISKVFTTIMEDTELQQELAQKETIEDVYNFCVSISGGYTMDEFKEFLMNLLKKVDSVPEEQLKKISGGTKLNNKALSAVLASISLASPLVGAADSTQEVANQNQPSKIGSFLKGVKETVLKKPVEFAVGGATAVAAAGTIIWAILSGKNQQGGQSGNNQEQNSGNNQVQNPRNNQGQNPRNNQVQNPAPHVNLPTALQDINMAEVSRQNSLVDLFNVVRGSNGKTAQTLYDRCVGAIRGPAVWHRFAGDVMNVLGCIDMNINLANCDSYRFYRTVHVEQRGNVMAHDVKGPVLSDPDTLKIGTSNIQNLDDLNLEIKRRGDDWSPVRLSSNQKAIVVRYMQLMYLNSINHLS